jgi:hypothetical protein
LCGRERPSHMACRPTCCCAPKLVRIQMVPEVSYGANGAIMIGSLWGHTTFVSTAHWTHIVTESRHSRILIQYRRSDFVPSRDVSVSIENIMTSNAKPTAGCAGTITQFTGFLYCAAWCGVCALLIVATKATPASYMDQRPSWWRPPR